MKTDKILILSADALNKITAQEPRFKQVLKGYNGEVALVEVSNKSMLVPNIPKIIDKILFAWAFVIFGGRGNSSAERVLTAELSKCLSGKAYSVKKLADVAEQLPNKEHYRDYESAQVIRL